LRQIRCRHRPARNPCLIGDDDNAETCLSEHP
jgi:hypothetical protein